MILDCFSFFNEIKMLLLRLEYHYDYVDRFIVVEANRTHVGNPKPYYLDQYWDAIPSRYLKKVLRVRTELPEDDGSTKKIWSREYGQRSVMIKALADHVKPQPHDLVFISDLDEIFHRDLLATLSRTAVARPLKIEQLLLMYNPDTYQEPWTHAFVAPAGILTEENVNPIRLDKKLEVLPKGGWHFSYHMSPELILHKIKNFAHPEFNRPEYTNLEYIVSCIRDRKTLFKQFGDTPYQEYSRSLYPRDLKNLLDLYFPYDEYNLYHQDQRPG